MLCSFPEAVGVGCAGPPRRDGAGVRERFQMLGLGSALEGAGSRAGVQMEALDHIAKCVNSDSLNLPLKQILSCLHTHTFRTTFDSSLESPDPLGTPSRA